MRTELLSLDLPQPQMQTAQHGGFVELARTVSALGGEADSATWPSLPSLLRKANRRFLMDRIDTNTIPDFATLTDISYDTDLYAAIDMISADTIKKMKIGEENSDPTYARHLNDLDAKVDLPDLYRNTTYDELRYGNSIVLKRLEDKVFVDCEIVHPGRIYNMKLGPLNKPMWWVFKKPDFDDENDDESYVGYLDPKYRKYYDEAGLTDNIVGFADEVVHFKGNALRYQTWGVGITQVAKILIEAKIDMLVDFSKIIKMNASPKEYLYVNVEGLRDGPAEEKINRTIESVTAQRRLNSIIVLGKDEAEAHIIGSEGKVLDTFSLHYRDDLLRAIRILTRVPPSFWLGEATNKATINSQVTVYNGFIDSNRFNHNRKYERGIFYPYLLGFDPFVNIQNVPPIVFTGPAIQDPMDKIMMDDISIRNGSKSRKQVAEEWNFRLPEDDGEVAPSLGSPSQIAEIIKKGRMEEELSPDV